MSDKDDDYPAGEEPTQAHRPFSEDEPTRMDVPWPPYDPERDPEKPEVVVPSTGSGGGETPRSSSIIAPLVTVALLAILFGIGIGYLLFGGDSGSSGGPTTTVQPTTTTESTTTTSTTQATSTSQRVTTTTRATSTSTSSSTTAKPTTTTTTVKPTTTTAKPTTTSTTVP